MASRKSVRRNDRSGRSAAQQEDELSEDSIPETSGPERTSVPDRGAIASFLTRHSQQLMARSLFDAINREPDLSEADRIRRMLTARESIARHLLEHRLAILRRMDVITIEALAKELGGSAMDFFHAEPPAVLPDSSLLDLVKFRMSEFFTTISTEHESEIQAVFDEAAKIRGSPVPTLPAPVLPTLRWAVGHTSNSIRAARLVDCFKRWLALRLAAGRWNHGMRQEAENSEERSQRFRERREAIKTDPELSEENRQSQLVHLEAGRLRMEESVKLAGAVREFLRNPYTLPIPGEFEESAASQFESLVESGFTERSSLFGLIRGFVPFWEGLPGMNSRRKNPKRVAAGHLIQSRRKAARLLLLVEHFVGHLGKQRRIGEVLNAIEDFLPPGGLRLHQTTCRSILHTLVINSREPVDCCRLLRHDHFDLTLEQIQPVLDLLGRHMTERD